MPKLPAQTVIMTADDAQYFADCACQCQDPETKTRKILQRAQVRSILERLVASGLVFTVESAAQVITAEAASGDKPHDDVRRVMDTIGRYDRDAVHVYMPDATGCFRKLGVITLDHSSKTNTSIADVGRMLANHVIKPHPDNTAAVAA